LLPAETNTLLHSSFALLAFLLGCGLRCRKVVVRKPRRHGRLKKLGGPGCSGFHFTVLAFALLGSLPTLFPSPYSSFTRVFFPSVNANIVSGFTDPFFSSPFISLPRQCALVCSLHSFLNTQSLQQNF
jgi:hypothetical protein